MPIFVDRVTTLYGVTIVELTEFTHHGVFCSICHKPILDGDKNYLVSKYPASKTACSFDCLEIAAKYVSIISKL